MYIVPIIIYILFISILIDQIRSLKDLLIPTKKSIGELTATFLGVLVILGITYLYADIWVYYILGILGATILGLSLLKTGITSRGFSYNRSYIGFLTPWNKVKRVEIIFKKHMIVSFTGHGYCDLYFKEDDYEKLSKILKENLSAEILIF